MRRCILAAALCVGVSAFAADTPTPPKNQLVITTKAGNTYRFNLADHPRVYVRWGYHSIVYKDSSYEISNGEVLKTEFVYSDPNGVSDTEIDAKGLSVNGDELTITAISKAPLQIFDASGALVLSRTITKEGESVSLVDLPAGVYMVSYNGQTLKIARK